jgi:hypothetical protein
MRDVEHRGAPVHDERRDVAVVPLEGRCERARGAGRAGVRERDLVLAGADGGEQRVEERHDHRVDGVEHALHRRTADLHRGTSLWLWAVSQFEYSSLEQTKWLIITLYYQKVTVNHFVLKNSIYLLKNFSGSGKKPITKNINTILTYILLVSTGFLNILSVEYYKAH